MAWYVAYFEITNSNLYLDTLAIYQKENPKEWRGIPFEPSPYRYEPCVYCRHVALPIHFTGKLVAVDHFIHKYYIHLGYQQWYAFQEVQLLTFEEGLLRDIQDFSERAALIRTKYIVDPQKPQTFTIDSSLSKRWQDYW